VHVRLAYAETGIAIYDNPLEISAASELKVPVASTQQPGVIGGANRVEASPDAPATTQLQEESSIWLWIAIGLGFLLLVIIVLLISYIAKMRRRPEQSEAL
jgi:heme/copper-type cytochrome/quinol oxidase subunit 2